MNTNDETEMKTADNAEAKEAVTTSSESKENDSSLQALVDEEQFLVRGRLRQELGREPTQEEVDKWLSEQTEGY